MDLKILGALAVVAGLASAAHAQPLVANPGLTSLLQPQTLDRSRPLISPDRSAGTRSGLAPAGPSAASPCDAAPSSAYASSAPASRRPAPPRPSLYGSGSGPGSYGRYIPGAPPPDSAAKVPDAPPSANDVAVADRPLYGGTDRPLWNTGERRPPAAVRASGKPAPASAGATEPGGTAPAPPNALPTPVRDRPLWTNRSLSGSPDPEAGPAAAATPDPGAGDVASSPCVGSSASLLPR